MVFVGQTNLLITLDTNSDLSGATGAEMIAVNPDGVRYTWTATIAGSTVNHATAAGELNKCGMWKLQAKIFFAAGPTFGNIENMQVDLPL